MNNSDLEKEKVATSAEATNELATTSETSEVKETEKNEGFSIDERTKVSTEEKKDETPSTKEEDTKKDETPTTTSTTTTDKEEKPLELKYLDKKFIYDVLSVPSHSRAEYRMVTFIMMWARENNVKYEFDDYGNIYLTKGELEEGEFYPCVTSHMDTVQTAQEVYAQCGIPLPLLERTNFKGQHELYVKGMGIGADDKAGILISLSLFKYAKKIKACFFLEEEIGCCGSKRLNKNWFDNVGYVIGWDSPDRNRAAFACSSELLMSKALFQEIEETCKNNGVTDFRSEPFTDVKEIRIQTGVQCMNFGNGGYAAHMPTEYVVLEDMDGACGLGVALLEKLGTRSFRMASKTFVYNVNNADEDIAFFAKRNSYYNGYNSTTYTRTTTTTRTTTPTTTTTKQDDKIESQMLEYVVERYEKFIEEIQKKTEDREAIIIDGIKQLCAKHEIDFKEFLDLFVDNPSTEPFSTAIEF